MGRAPSTTTLGMCGKMDKQLYGVSCFGEGRFRVRIYLPTYIQGGRTMRQSKEKSVGGRGGGGGGQYGRYCRWCLFRKLTTRFKIMHPLLSDQKSDP